MITTTTTMKRQQQCVLRGIGDMTSSPCMLMPRDKVTDNSSIELATSLKNCNDCLGHVCYSRKKNYHYHPLALSYIFFSFQ